MGQLEALQGHRQQAYDAYKHVIRLSPPYELEFNARISQSEVMATYDAKSTIKKLRRMAASDNNKDYLDQVYYAIGNVYLAQRDTMNAIAAYEKGNMKAGDSQRYGEGCVIIAIRQHLLATGEIRGCPQVLW